MALLKFKRSAVPAKVPALNDLALGELAINTYDGKVYTKKDDGTPAIVQVGGGGGVQTITSSDGSVTVTGTTDINLSVPVTAATNTVILPVRNNTGATLAKGTAVYINGALGQNPTVTKALATGDATSAQTLGLVTANIANNAVGNVTLIGSLTNLDTSAYTDGQQLYLSPTTAGALTATKPYAPNHLVYMAVVEHAHPTLGKLFVKVQNGYEMDELHNVAAQSPANNDGLFYNTSTSLWEKKSIATALGYTPANKAGDTFNGVVSIYSSNDAQLYLNGNGTSWAGMSWADVSGSDFIWYNGSTSTFAIGGGGSFVANKKLHVHGGMTIGSGLAMSASGTNSLSVEGNVTSNVDVRAPIFYDSNDTSYYVDPNSNSNFIVVYASEFYNRGWFRTNDSDKGLYNQATGQHWYSDSGNFWNMGGGNLNGQGIRFRDNHQGTVRGYVYYDQSNNVGFLNSDGNWRARVVGGDYFLADGSSARAQIFYDSNDTAYYINGAGDSVLNTLYFRNGSIQAKFAQASNFGYSSSYRTVVLGNEYLTTISMGVDVSGNASGSFNGQGEGREVLFRNGVSFITPNAANTNYLNVMQMTDGVANFTAYSTAAGSFRAPIFYDSNNTGYYVDPASTSALNIITTAGYIQTYSGGVKWDESGTRSWSMYPSGGAILLNSGDGAGSFNLGASGGVRAPIFYDSNDTNNYVDPNSHSNIWRLTASNRSMVGSAQISMAGLDANTWYPVTIPIPVGRQTTLRIENALNSNVPSWSTHPSGFSCYFEWTANGLGWGTIGLSRRITDWREQYASVQIVGGIDQMTFSSQEVIWLRGGANYFFSADCDVTPTIRTTTYDAYGQTVAPRSTVYNDPWSQGVGKMAYGTFQANERVTAGTDIRAPIFYDSQNTGYYVDAAAGFYLAGAGSTTYQSTSSGLFVANPESTGSTVRLGAAWSRAGSYSNGSYTLGSESSIHFWISNLEKGYIDSSSNLFMNGSVRAPIFYDSQNTGYYVDPNSTSTLYRTNGDGFAASQFLCGMTNYGDQVSASTWYGIGRSNVTGYFAGGMVQVAAYTGLRLRGPYSVIDLDGAVGGDLINFTTATGRFTGDVRATTFYDVSNTTYYVDPAGMSQLTYGRFNGDWASSGVHPEQLTVRGTYPSLTLRATNSNQAYWLFHNNGTNLEFYGGRGNPDGGSWDWGFRIYGALDGTYGEGNSSLRAPIFYDSNNTAYYLDASSTGTSLNVAGSIVAAGNVTAYSDIRIKDNIETIPSALDKLDHIRGVTYTRTDLDDKEQRYAGVIAQEIEAVLPEAVRDLGNIKAVDYNATIALLIEAVKELSLKVKTLEEKDN